MQPQEYIAKQRKQAESDRDRLHREERIAELLTRGGDVQQISGHKLYNSIGSVRFAVKDRAEALALVAEYPASPVALVRAGCVGIKPIEAITAREQNRAVILDEILPVWWELEPGYGGGHQFPGHAQISWYSRLADDALVKMSARIESDPARVYANHERDQANRIVRHRWAIEKQPNGEFIRYASGTHNTCGKFLQYFFMEPGDSPDLYHYLACDNPAGEDARFYGWREAPEVVP